MLSRPLLLLRQERRQAAASMRIALGPPRAELCQPTVHTRGAARHAMHESIERRHKRVVKENMQVVDIWYGGELEGGVPARPVGNGGGDGD